MPTKEHTNAKRVVIARRTGRLANRLVLYANFAAFSEEHGYRLINGAFLSFAHLFQSSTKDVYCRYPIPPRRSALDRLPGVPPFVRKTRISLHLTRIAQDLTNRIPFIRKKLYSLFENEDDTTRYLDDPAIIEEVADARVIFGSGWRFRAPSLVKAHAEKLRKHFRPLEETERGIDELVSSIRTRADLIVGVHVRQGDYRSWEDGRYFYEPSRYAHWMNEMATELTDHKVAFLVTSDEKRTPDEFPGLDVTIAPGPPVFDLYALASCDYVIGPVSTFSQWASFYGNTPLQFMRSNEDRVELAKFEVSFLEEIPGFRLIKRTTGN